MGRPLSFLIPPVSSRAPCEVKVQRLKKIVLGEVTAARAALADQKPSMEVPSVDDLRRVQSLSVVKLFAPYPSELYPTLHETLGKVVLEAIKLNGGMEMQAGDWKGD